MSRALLSKAPLITLSTPGWMRPIYPNQSQKTAAAALAVLQIELGDQRAATAAVGPVPLHPPRGAVPEQQLPHHGSISGRVFRPDPAHK